MLPGVSVVLPLVVVVPLPLWFSWETAGWIVDSSSDEGGNFPARTAAILAFSLFSLSTSHFSAPQIRLKDLPLQKLRQKPSEENPAANSCL